MRAYVGATTLQLELPQRVSTFRVMTALEPSPLEITETRIGGARGLALKGELDFETATRFTEQVEFAVWGTQGAFVRTATTGIGSLNGES